MYKEYAVYKDLHPYRAMMNLVKLCLKDLSNLSFRLSSRYLFLNIAPCISVPKDPKGVLCFFYFETVFDPEVVGSCFDWKIIIKDSLAGFFFDKQLLTKLITFMV